MTTTQRQHLQLTAWERIESVDEAMSLARASAARAEAEARMMARELTKLDAERQALVDAAGRAGQVMELEALDLREEVLTDRCSSLRAAAAARARQVHEREVQAHVMLVDGWRDLAAELDAQATDARVNRELVALQSGGAQALQAQLEAEICGRWKRLLKVFPPHGRAPEPGGTLAPAIRPDRGGSWLASFELEEWWPRWLVERHAEAAELRRGEEAAAASSSG